MTNTISSPVNLVDCTLDAHGEAILALMNDVIVNSTALYDYTPRPLDSMTAWFADKRAGQYPVIGASDDNGVLLGFASYGSFRPRPANKYTVEHSVYVHAEHRGRGVARALMEHLIAAARAQQLHVLVGGIDVTNAASIRLHEQLGFTHAGTIEQAAFKFGRWLDLGFWQLILDTPQHPIDG